MKSTKHKGELMNPIKATPANLTMFICGLVLLLVGLYRMAPIDLSIRKVFLGFAAQVGPLVLALVVITIWLYSVGGSGEIKIAGLKTLGITSNFVPVIVLLFPVMAVAGQLILHHQAEVRMTLRGAWGYPGALGAAFAIPSSNAAAEPIKLFWEEDQGLRPMLLYFLTCSALVCWPIFFFRVLGLTFEIGWKMYAANFGSCAILMPYFWLFGRLFYKKVAVAHGIQPVPIIRDCDC